MHATALPEKCGSNADASADASASAAREAGQLGQAVAAVTVCNSLEECEALRADWMRLTSHADHNWLLYWSVMQHRNPSPEPYVAALIEGNRMRAALVGRVESSQVHLKLGYWKPLRFPVRRIVIQTQGRVGEEAEDALERLMARIVQDLRDRKADLAVFEYLEQGSALHRAAKRAAVGIGMRDLVSERQIHRYVRLPPTFRDYHRRHRRLMEKVRKFEKAFEGRCEHRVLTREDEIDFFCNGADAAMRQTYQRALGVGFCISAENREKIRAAARQEAWRAFVTLVEGRMVAFWCGCSFAGSWLCWWTGYDPDYQEYSPGLVASTRMIERFIDEGITTIDFGGGDATHKERLGNEARWEESVCIYAPRLRGVCANGVRALNALVGNLSRTTLKRFANRLKTPWRRLMARKLSRRDERARTSTGSQPKAGSGRNQQ